jgi:hypothetical protein
VLHFMVVYLLILKMPSYLKHLTTCLRFMIRDGIFRC